MVGALVRLQIAVRQTSGPRARAECKESAMDYGARQMTDRVRRCSKRTRATMLARALVLVGTCASAVGCGAGDDTMSAAPVAPKADAGSGADATAASPAKGGSPDASVSDASHGDATAGGADAGTASAMFSQAPLNFGGVNCSTSGSRTLTIANGGSAALTVSASTT